MKKLFYLFVLLNCICFLGYSTIIAPKNSCIVHETSLKQILQDVNISIINEIVESENEDAAREFLEPVTDRIISYLLTKYPEQFIEDSLQANRVETIRLAYALSVLEETNFSIEELEEHIEASSSNGGSWVMCALTVVGGYFIGREFIDSIRNVFVTGISGHDAWVILKRFLRVNFVWFTAAYLIYEVAHQCF